ncbi:MAG: addiction module protein [Planctomycetes bacterium]|nr:addiction module protein [Planctomycetota bacterium]
MANAVDTDQLLKLSPEKRLELISLLWNSLVTEDAPVDLDEETWAEAARRAEELKANPEIGISLEELRKKRGWNA